MVTRRSFTAGSLLAMPAMVLRSGPVSAQLSEMPPVAQSSAEQIAIDAYIYGYSLITTEVTRVQMTNVPKAEALRSPMGQFTNVRRYPPGDYRGVSAPNADTLYSLAWVDVGPEPAVFSHPDMGNRFYLFPMYSLWMPVFAVARPPHRRWQGGDLSDLWAWMERQRARRHAADQIADALLRDPRPHLRRWERCGFRCRECPAGQISDRAAQRLWQAL